ncbi:MAG: hypothetical protein Kow0069_34100 [Promethearchaeota archaeon]
MTSSGNNPRAGTDGTPADGPVAFVVCDDRERAVASELEQYPVCVVVQRLDVADFLVSAELAVERKRGDDLVASILDDRLWDELERMRCSFEKPVLVVEQFDKAFSRGNVKPASVYGALGYVATRYGVPVVPTRDAKDTALLLYRLSVREHVRDDPPVRARSVPKRYSPSQRKAFLLEGLYDTGPTKARALLDHFGTVSAVIDALRKAELTYSPSGRPKLDRSCEFRSLRGFGPSWVEKNKRLVES